jgi:hypothetical protein
MMWIDHSSQKNPHSTALPIPLTLYSETGKLVIVAALEPKKIAPPKRTL